ncbi:MAG: hypothetical protein J0I20_25905 [Chloroflexi bacterium]|nr:hypothetical protein [Chloroflexota bacterium]OJW06507.1 MAG: hypothetical protein BGO39_00395 [Chloroflexi bacterium 54-19]
MFVLKLLLTPLLIALISLADRRWGPKVGGILLGLPLTSAPVSLFVTLDLGASFTAHMAIGNILGLFSQALFCVTYAWLSYRVNWLGCWLIGWGAFGVSTLVFEQVAVPLPVAFTGITGAFIGALVIWPQHGGEEFVAEAPAWALVGRMVAATAMVIFLTSTASLLGPQLSGLLSPLPIFATVFAVFAHKLQGGRPARLILHGVIVSSFACAVFFLIVAEFIDRWSIVATYSSAIIAALLTQGLMVGLIRRFQNRKIARQLPL